MSLFRLGLQLGNASRTGLHNVISLRSVSRTCISFQKKQVLEDYSIEPTKQSKTNVGLHDLSDRSKKIPVELSIKYLESDAYTTAYGQDPVWLRYRRNYKGHFMPIKTRKTCIRNNVITTGNPCPICRDEYLVLDYRNTKLLKQFISTANGEILGFKKTGLCQRAHKQLLIAIYKAKDYGTISYDVPFFEYDYSEWYDESNSIEHKHDCEELQDKPLEHEHEQCDDKQKDEH